MKKNKKVYLEAIRVFAIIGVIFNHTDGFIYYTSTENPVTWLYSITLSVICRTAVPLFFLIAGSLLLEKEESLKELFLKRILRILCVLLVFSLLYYIFDSVSDRISEMGINDFIRRVLNNDIRESFWFLYEYLFFLLILPFFRFLTPKLNHTLIGYLIVLRGIATFVLPVLNQLCGVSVKFDIGFGEDYIYYALLGYYFSHVENYGNEIKTRTLWFVFVGLVSFNVVITHIIYLIKGNYSAETVDYVVFISAPVLFLIFRRIFGELSDTGKINTCIITMGSCVFGIYLWDNFVRWQFLPVYLFLSEKTVGILACSVYVMLVFIFGFLYTWILKKIPLMKRYL